MAFVRVPGNDIPAGAEEHWLEGRGGVKVRVMTAPSRGPARGTVIVAPGRTEFIEKYFEVIGELQARGFVVFCIDWRGQGLSGREVDNPQKGHLVTFDDPVNDLATALKLLGESLPRPHIVLAHSMGGAIILRALQTRRIEVEAAAFSSPMWGIAGLTKPAKWLVRFLTSVGAGGQYAPGVETRWKSEPFKKNPVTHDKARHARTQGLVTEEPRLALAGPTNGWVAAAADVTEGFVQPGAMGNIRIPVLVATAGQEMLVDNAAQDEVIAELPDARHITIEEAKHEILMELDPLRAEFWAAFDELVNHVMSANAAAQ